jgi:uncharacterized protein YrzB (UPF0473 family)
MSEKRTIRIEDGLSIYKMDGSKNWYVYINKLGIKRQFSLKTDDENKARHEATRQLIAVEMEASGDVVSTRLKKKPKNTVAEVAKLTREWFAAYKKNVSERTTKEYVRMLSDDGVLVKNFGQLAIKDFGTNEIENFYVHEGNGSSKTRQTMYRTLIGKLFDIAVRNKMMIDSEVPSYNGKNIIAGKPKVDKVDKNFVKDEQLEALRNSYDSIIASSTKDETKANREFCIFQAEFINETGVRPGEEIEGIRFSDISLHEDEDKNGNIQKFLSAKVIKGKTSSSSGKSRDVVLSAEAIHIINQICIDHYSQMFLDFIEAMNTKNKNEGEKQLHEMSFSEKRQWCEEYFDMYRDDLFQFVHDMKKSKFEKNKVFLRPDKQDKGNMPHIFAQIAERALGENSDIVLYSFRHRYINKALLKGTDIYIIAKNCGNSAEVIQKYYDHLHNIKLARKMTDFDNLDPTKSNY